MSRRIPKIRVELNAGNIKSLPDQEIVIILRGADELIASGGRSMLAKLLKGSKEKKLLELGLDQNPSYGYYQDLPLLEVQQRIDWVMLNDYLRYFYDKQFPLLEYTRRGWEIEKNTYADELLAKLEAMIEAPLPQDWDFLNNRNRELILLLIDKLQDTQDKRFIPLLKHWQEHTFKKLKVRLKQAIDAIATAE